MSVISILHELDRVLVDPLYHRRFFKFNFLILLHLLTSASIDQRDAHHSIAELVITD